MTTQFQTGKTYASRSIVNSDTWNTITVARRTAKTIWTTCGKQLRVFIYEGVEQVKPNGSYSMCAVIGADDLKKDFDFAKPKADTVDSLMKEGKALFTEEQFADIVDTLRQAHVYAPVITKPSAKVYNFADYRK